MKAIITNYRYWVLTLLGIVVSLGFVAMPADGIGFWAYVAVLFGSKIVALAVLALAYNLFLRWSNMGDIPELTEFIGEED